MKWKVTVQFLVALIIVSVAVNFINAAVMSYYFFKNKASNVVNGDAVFMIRLNAPFDFSTFNTRISFLDGTPEVMPAALEQLKKANGFVQFIDNKGDVLKSINKPEGVSILYSSKEAGNLGLPEIKGGDSGSPQEPGGLELPKIKAIGYNVTVQNIKTVEGKQIKYVIALPKPKVTVFSIFYGFISYFLIWNEPKAVAMILTILTALLLGYFFAKKLTKPVVKVVEGISGLEKGDYHRQYPAAGLYKDVFKSLNNLAVALQANEVERKKIEKMREEWIMNITHDLKTPLSSIKGYAELLTEPEYSLISPEGKNYAEVILNKSNYMDTLLEDLKLTQKLKNDLIPLKREAVNLVDVLRETVIGILNNPGYSERKIIFEPEEEKLWMDCDPILMQRALGNILLNAVVHNPEETEVRVGIRQKDGILVEIEDNGRGIPEEDLQKLFERYYRGTNTEESHNGSGLGLAIAKQIIEAHGGSIELESKVDEGTKVRIRFELNK